MRPSLYGRFMAREARGSRGRLAFFTLCLAVGVSAVVGVAGLSASLDDGIRSRAKMLLAADLMVHARGPLPKQLDAAIEAIPGARRTDVRQTLSVVSAPQRAGQPGSSLLVELRAVSGEFPFYGRLELEPDVPLSQLLDENSVVVAPELLARLKIPVGGALRVGGAEFRIAGIVRSEPDRAAVAFVIGPRVFISSKGLARTDLTGFGSRFDERALIKLASATTSAAIAATAERIKNALPESAFAEVETYEEAQPALREALKRAWTFLSLGALLSLLIGGIGVGQTVTAWLAGRMDAIAILKCLGMRPREILLLYLGQTALLGLAGSLAGVLLGVVLQILVPRLLGGFVAGFSSGVWHPQSMLRGLVLGVAVAIVFSLPPLVSILRVPPSLVMRRDAEPLRTGRWARAASAACVLAGIFGTAWAQSGSRRLGAVFTGGVVVIFLLLTAAAFLVRHVLARAPRRLASVAVRHGLASLARPARGTTSAIAALGLGVFVVLSMYLVQSHLRARLQAELPLEAPTAFMIDIQPDQWPGVKHLLEEQGATQIDSVPVVDARLTSLDGRRVEDLAKEDRPGAKRRVKGRSDRARRWALTREQRLTYMATLPASNTIVSGALWKDPAKAEISLEEDFAKDLGAHLGSTITFEVQGVPLTLEVTSLRKVTWESFGINFFLIVEPGVLEKAPQVRVGAARLPQGREQQTQDLLAARFPNIVMIKIRQVLETIVAIMRRVGLGVGILGGFTVAAGIAILAGAISAGSIRRGREVALLKTLGMTRWGVVAAFSSEYLLIGLIAGTIGAVGAGVMAWAILTRLMQIPWTFEPLAFAGAIAATAALAMIAGLAASARALARRPIDVLRGEL